MWRKSKGVFVEVIIIVCLSLGSAFVANELRADKLPLLPLHLEEDSFTRISLDDFLNMDQCRSSTLVFDARPHGYYEKTHLPGSLNFPVTEFDFFFSMYLSHAAKDSPLFIYGRTLSRAYALELACKLSGKGFKNLTLVDLGDEYF